MAMDGMVQHQDDAWSVAGRRFSSRLVVGTGKYKDLEETAAAIEASGAEMVTVAVRRVNLSDPGAPMLQDYVDPKRYTYLPNTAGCHTAQDAVRTLRLAREAGGWNLVKLEVLGPPPFLYPDMRATFEAAEALLKDGFEVMVYCSDDPIAAKRLEEIALGDDYFVERKLYPNVDFYTGVIYKAMGFPEKMFTVLFALGRLPGWIAQWRELMEDPATKIGRPRQIYVGEQLRQYPQR